MPTFNFRSSKSALDRRHLVSPVLQARRRLGYVIAFGVVLCALTYFFYSAPKTSAESTANATLATNQQLLSTAEANLKSTASGTTNACVEYRQDRALDQLLPATQPNISLAALSNLIQSAGLAVSSISPPPSTPLATAAGALYAPYTIATSGTYSEVHAAVEAVDAYSPLITVAAVNISASTTTTGDLTATLKLDEWWYPALNTLPVVTSATCR
jgi:Tfp pilus assembly protein PilO